MEIVLLRRFLLLLAPLMLSCDPMDILRRQATIYDAPRSSCVERVLEDNEQVDDRVVEISEASTEGELVYHYAYSVDGWTVGLRVVNRNDGVIYSQYMARVGHALPEEAVESVRPTMLEVEASLISECGMQPADEVEECRGVDCANRSP